MDDQSNAVNTRSRLDDALALLDPQSRQVVRLWLEGEGDGEVAVRMDLPEPIVASIRSRSLSRVQESIARESPR